MPFDIYQYHNLLALQVCYIHSDKSHIKFEF
jgi:hypothetical protein